MPASQTLRHYFLANYLIAFALCLQFFARTHWAEDRWTFLFSLAVQLTYPFIYLWPAVLLATLSARLPGRWTQALVTVVATALSTIFMYADAFLHKLYGFHINGFVLNLLTTPGGIESMGGGTQTSISFALRGVLFFAAQGLLYLLCQRYDAPLQRLLSHPALSTRTLLTVFVVITVAERMGYGFATALSHAPIRASANAYPLYQPVTFSSALRTAGFTIHREVSVSDHSQGLAIHYPKADIRLSPPSRPHNIVWLVSESWRWDMLDPEIMPNTWAFAQKANRFTRHYSGGNGTRMGMFSMFYGLHGSYWFSMLNEQRPPVIMNALKALDYQWSFYTSAAFTYPEFDRTVFANVEKENLHDDNAGVGRSWQVDRRNVGRLIDYIDQRDPARPFMTFMFFESPHANYYFPEDTALRKDYLPELNYADMDLERDIDLIKHRYINACHHLDQQFGRILDYLEKHDLLKNTIVLITGDHGEEFLEKGRWGHNSEFHEEQIRPPLILWLPEVSGQVIEHRTSHIDIVPTLAPYLGITNPPRDYTLGKSLLGHETHDYVVISDWSSLGIVDDEMKVRMPLAGSGLDAVRATDHEDQPIDLQHYFRERRERVMTVMRELGEFRRH
jgi:membrane-anchored protein YejM (alkaline phosphatase superfamily)